MILINLNGKDSIYEQIVNQIKRLIKLGALKKGEKLPSVRMLAQDLGINPNTVARAYTTLEEEGIIYTLNKKGVYVSDDSKDETILLLQVEKTLLEFKKEGISKKELKDIINNIYGDTNVKNK